MNVGAETNQQPLKPSILGDTRLLAALALPGEHEEAFRVLTTPGHALMGLTEETLLTQDYVTEMDIAVRAVMRKNKPQQVTTELARLKSTDNRVCLSFLVNQLFLQDTTEERKMALVNFFDSLESPEAELYAKKAFVERRIQNTLFIETHGSVDVANAWISNGAKRHDGRDQATNEVFTTFLMEKIAFLSDPQAMLQSYAPLVPSVHGMRFCASLRTSLLETLAALNPDNVEIRAAIVEDHIVKRLAASLVELRLSPDDLPSCQEDIARVYRHPFGTFLLPLSFHVEKLEDR